MTARLYLTVYADDDLPTTAAHIASKSLGTVTACTELTYTKHLHGTGALKLKINRHHPQAALLIADRYVIAHSDIGPVGGAFLDHDGEINLSAAEGKGDEWIIWKGRGPIAVLERVVMDNDSNVSGGHQPISGHWDLSNQGIAGIASNGHPIPMMRRGLNETVLNPPNGIAMVDSSSWDYDLDSDGNTPPFWGEIVYGADVGDDLLSLAAEMSLLGEVVWEMTHLFKFNAYLTYGTDRQGAFGAAGKVRFQKGVNIADAIQRTVRGSVLRTHLVVGGANRTYVKVTDPDYVSGDVIRWGFLSMPETADTATLAGAGLAHIEARKRQTDVWSFPQHDHGNNIAAGIYEPGPPGTAGAHYWVGDTVTLHSGTGLYDANNLGVPISAITWQLKTGEEANGDYWVIPQVGATFDWPPPGPGQQHIPPAPPGGGFPPLTCDNYATAGVLTGKWVNPSVAVDVTNWRDTPNTGAAARVASPGGSPPAPWSFRGNSNHRWHTFAGQTFEEGKSYAFAFWVYDTVAGTGGSGGVGVGHSLVSVTNHWGAGDYEDTVFESYPDLVSATWTKQCVIWTPTATYGNDVRIDFHLQDQYITACEVWESATGDIPLPPTEGGSVGDPSQFATATHQHPFQEAGDTPYDDAVAALGVDDVQAALEALDAALDALAGATGDHGGLTGLTDDDHTQYVLKTLGGKETVHTIAAAGATPALNLANGNWQDVTLNQNATPTLTGATAGTGCSMLLYLRPAGFTVTWPGSVAWPGGEEPDLTDVDLVPISLITNDGGTTWLGAFPGSGGGAAGGTGTAFTVDSGTPTYDDTGPGFVEVSVTSKFGIDAAGDPYFNSAGVTSGEEAALMRDSETGAYFLRPYTF